MAAHHTRAGACLAGARNRRNRRAGVACRRAGVHHRGRAGAACRRAEGASPACALVGREWALMVAWVRPLQTPTARVPQGVAPAAAAGAALWQTACAAGSAAPAWPSSGLPAGALQACHGARLHGEN